MTRPVNKRIFERIQWAVWSGCTAIVKKESAGHGYIVSTIAEESVPVRREDLPSWITERMAILDMAGPLVGVSGVGYRYDTPGTYYITN